jgi:uncharacterized membrane protein
MNPWVQALHAAAGMLWVGGIFFAYMGLRPAAEGLPPEERLRLWHRVFSRFFPWVWIFIALLLVTGYWDLFARFGGFGGPLYLSIMHLVGLVMIILFAYLHLFLYRALGSRLTKGDVSGAARAMGRIRPIMVINLALGVLLIFVGVAGPGWA